MPNRTRQRPTPGSVSSAVARCRAAGCRPGRAARARRQDGKAAPVAVCGGGAAMIRIAEIIAGVVLVGFGSWLALADTTPALCIAGHPAPRHNVTYAGLPPR